MTDNASSLVRHPLDPLTVDEIDLATFLLHKTPMFQMHMRIIMILLIEPDDKSLVIQFKLDETIPRSVSVLIRDPIARTTYEVIIDLTEQRAEQMIEHKNCQPPLTLDELVAAEQSLRTSEALIDAFLKRNINMNEVVFYAFSAGYRDENDDPAKRRIYRPYAAIRKYASDNYYAHHIDGLVITVDLDMFTVHVEDYEVIPVPMQSGNYDPEGIQSPSNVPHFQHGPRKDLKPLIITQPEGPSFQIDGHLITWQKWRFRVGFNFREGLTIHMVEYFDQQCWRPILYRAAINEMWVPYADPSKSQNYKSAFDVGEAGIGCVVNSLVLGCDCLGEIRYLDVVLNNNKGEAIVRKNAICIHEEDAGVLWKHTEFLEQRTEMRRSRRLVVSCIATAGNYEYGFYWFFQQDGAIHCEIKLTGIIAPGAIQLGKTPLYGELVAEGLYGPHHQHFFNMRIDWMLDGQKNSLVEVNCEPISLGPENPMGNGWVARETVIGKVGEARRSHDSTKGRFWKVINPQMKNHVHSPVGYRIIPIGSPCYPICPLESPQMKRGTFARYHLWATRYHAEELYASGRFPNQSKGDSDGIAIYSEQHMDESLIECDLVTWYTFGCVHVVRPEDWPVMPVEMVGVRLLPVGFFAGNPAGDVPPSPSPSPHNKDLTICTYQHNNNKDTKL